MRRLGVRGLLMAVVCLCMAPALGGAVSDGGTDDLAHRALVECEAGRRAAARTERQSHFERGQGFAERAVAANDDSVDAESTQGRPVAGTARDMPPQQVSRLPLRPS